MRESYSNLNNRLASLKNFLKIEVNMKINFNRFIVFRTKRSQYYNTE